MILLIDSKEVPFISFLIINEGSAIRIVGSTFLRNSCQFYIFLMAVPYEHFF